MTGKTGQYLRDNDWLMNIRSRMIIPGGACEFDLPSYHAWQQHGSESRVEDLQRWLAPLAPLRHALAIVLKLLRESGQSFSVVAVAASYQQMLSGKTFQMMQVRIDETHNLIPEISANKYMLWVRFTQADEEMRTTPAQGDLPFELTLCNL